MVRGVSGARPSIVPSYRSIRRANHRSRELTGLDTIGGGERGGKHSTLQSRRHEGSSAICLTVIAFRVLLLLLLRPVYADPDRAANIRIYDTVIQDLAMSPIQVPVLVHDEGGILTGPAGDVLRFSDHAQYRGQYSMRQNAKYIGNAHSDAVVALFKLANGKASRSSANSSFPHPLQPLNCETHGPLAYFGVALPGW